MNAQQPEGLENTSPNAIDSPPPRTSFLHGIVLLFIIPYVALAIWLGAIHLTGENDAELSYTSGRIAAGILWPLLLSYLAFRICRRSRFIATFVYCLLTTLFIASTSVQIRKAQLMAQSAADKQSLATLDRFAAGAKAIAEREAAGETITVEERQSLLNETVNELEQSAKDNGSRTAKLNKAFADALRSIQPAITAYGESLQEFERLGGIDPNGITQRQHIVERLAALDTFQKCNTELREVFTETPHRIVERLVQDGFSRGEASYHAKQYERGARPDLAARLRQLDAEGITCFRGVLELFEEQWGKWTYDPDGGQLHFEDDTSIAQYNSLIERIGVIGAEQEALEEEIRKNQREIERKN